MNASPEARHGLSLRHIARLSPEAWARVAQGSRDDEAQDVYGVALRAENRRLSIRTEPIRRAAFRYGMACIAVEDTLAGGGTYSIHAPHEMFASSERMIQSLVGKKARPRVPRSRRDEVERTFERCLALRTAPERVLGGEVDLPVLRRFARLALIYERELRRLATVYSPSVRANVDRFTIDWGGDYLAVRGARELVSGTANNMPQNP